MNTVIVDYLPMEIDELKACTVCRDLAILEPLIIQLGNGFTQPHKLCGCCKSKFMFAGLIKK